MTSSSVADVILQQRFQSLERELRSAKLNVKKAQTELQEEKRISEDVKSKNQNLTNALTASQTEKLKLEAEMRQFLKQRQNFTNTSTSSFPASQFTTQFSQLREKLDNVLNSKSHTDGQIQDLTSQLSSTTTQLESKEQELKNLEKELRKVEDQKSSLSIRLKFSEEKGVQQRVELEQRLEKWLQNEKQLTEQIQQLINERDEVKINYEKKTMEFTKLTQTLKDTTHALGNCLSVIKRSPDLTEVLSEDIGDQMLSIRNSLSPIRGLIEDGPSTLKTSEDLDLSSEIHEIPMEDLRSRHTSLIAQYNKEVKESLLLDNDRETQINFKNKAWTEVAALKLQLSESQKITQQKEEKIEALKSHIEHLQHTIEDTEEAKIGLKVRLESVQKTSDDLTAQVKFLLTRIEHLKESMDPEVQKASKRPRVAMIGRKMDTGRCESVHDVVEENRRLREAAYRHQQEKSQLTEELEQLRDSTSLPLTQGSLIEDAPIISKDPGPSKRLKRVHDDIEEDEEDVEWKAKWEAAELELSQLRSERVEVEAEMNRVIESSTNEAMKTQEDLRRLEQGVMEYRAKYEALLETYRNQGELYQSDIESKASKLKELEALVKVMTSEMDSQKFQIDQMNAALAVNVQKYETEKQAYVELQNRMISTEAEHLEELKKLKDEMDEQISSIHNLVSPQLVHEDPQQLTLGGPSNQEMEALIEKIKGKDQVITELERRLQFTLEPLRNDMVHDLQSKIALLQSSLDSEQHQKELLQKTLLLTQSQHQSEAEALREETSLLAKEKDSKIMRLELNLEETQMQISNLEKMNKELESTLLGIREEHSNQTRTHLEQDEVLKITVNSLKDENESLKKELSSKTTDLLNKSEVINSLRASGNVAEEQLKQLEKEKEDLKSRVLEQEAKLATSIHRSIPKDDHDLKMDSIPVQTPSIIETSKEDLSKSETQIPVPVPTINEAPEAKQDVLLSHTSPVETSQKRDLNSLLDIARSKYHSATASDHSKPVSNIDGHASTSGGVLEDHPPPSQEAEEKSESSKQKTWTPIVYSADKRPDQSGDRKKDRPSKH